MNLLKQGTLSIEAISQATGLTIEQVQQLQAANSSRSLGFRGEYANHDELGRKGL